MIDPLMRWNTTVAVLALVSLLAVPNDGRTREKDLAGRPNLVMILTDDQRYDAIGYAANHAIQTPNLDRLARSGLIFENSL